MALADELRGVLRPDQVATSQSIVEQHAHDESYHLPVLPEAVVFAESRDDVVRVMRLAGRLGVPVVAFGAGSGLEGHVVPVHGGISLDMTRMNEVLEVRPEDFLVHVQAGVTRNQLNERLRRYGLFFPVDPGADATLGGMAATSASGTTTVRYGSMREHVRSLEVVLASGEVIQTGSLAAKSASGYNLNNLFVGSEGTLGVFTELWLKVWGIPESTVAARVVFPTIEQAVRATTAVIGAGVPIVRIELVDGPYMGYINAYGKTDYPEMPTLFLEFRGSPAAVEADLETTSALLAMEGATDVVQLRDPAEQKRMWDVRHAAAFAFVAAHPGRKHLATDVCVPISRLPEAVTFAKNKIAEMGAPGAIVGHVGDGNFHVSLAVDPNNPAEVALATEYSGHLVEHALALGGTSTGEHGVGLGKKKYQEKEHGAAIEVMRGIKALLDPQHILNPGKLVDPE
jgi:D-lactate dehydrogenase (cytochrome)